MSNQWKEIVGTSREGLLQSQNSLLARFDGTRLMDWGIGHYGYHWGGNANPNGEMKWISYPSLSTINSSRTGLESLSQDTVPIWFDPTHYMVIPLNLEE